MYPVRYTTPNPGAGRNRLTVFFRYILSIPWMIVAALYGFAASFAVFFAWFAMVFTGRYPEGLYNFVAGYLRMITRVNGFFYYTTDEWPPFNGEEDPTYPVQLGIPAPKEEYSRMKALFRIIIGIPVIFLAAIQGFIAAVVGLIGWFAILFTGRLSDGLFTPLRSALAYQARTAAYFSLITEDWPPFTLEDDTAAAGQLPPTPPAESAPPAADPAQGEQRG